MPSINPVPEKVRNYQVYMNRGSQQKLLGVGNEMTMPDFEFMSETISGAGLLGEYDSPNVGHTSSTEIEIPFRLLTRQGLDLATGDIADIIIRAGVQSTDLGMGALIEKGLVVNVRGPVKKITIGTFSMGAPMESTVAIELLYFKCSEDQMGSLFTLLELDKLNFVYVVNGVDKLANLRRYI